MTASISSTLPCEDRVVTNLLTVHAVRVGIDTLCVNVAGEDGAGMITGVLQAVHEVEPLATISSFSAGTPFDLGLAQFLYRIVGSDPCDHARRLDAIKAALDAKFVTQEVSRTQIWTGGFCYFAYKTKDKPGLLASLTKVIADLRINFTSLRTVIWVQGPDGKGGKESQQCLVVGEMQLPERPDTMYGLIEKAVVALGLEGKLFFDADAIDYFREAVGRSGGSVFDYGMPLTQ